MAARASSRHRTAPPCARRAPQKPKFFCHRKSIRVNQSFNTVRFLIIGEGGGSAPLCPDRVLSPSATPTAARTASTLSSAAPTHISSHASPGHCWIARFADWVKPALSKPYNWGGGLNRPEGGIRSPYRVDTKALFPANPTSDCTH